MKRQSEKIPHINKMINNKAIVVWESDEKKKQHAKILGPTPVALVFNKLLSEGKVFGQQFDLRFTRPDATLPTWLATGTHWVVRLTPDLKNKKLNNIIGAVLDSGKDFLEKESSICCLRTQRNERGRLILELWFSDIGQQKAQNTLPKYYQKVKNIFGVECQQQLGYILYGKDRQDMRWLDDIENSQGWKQVKEEERGIVREPGGQFSFRADDEETAKLRAKLQTQSEQIRAKSLQQSTNRSTQIRQLLNFIGLETEESQKADAAKLADSDNKITLAQIQASIQNRLQKLMLDEQGNLIEDRIAELVQIAVTKAVNHRVESENVGYQQFTRYIHLLSTSRINASFLKHTATALEAVIEKELVAAKNTVFDPEGRGGLYHCAGIVFVLIQAKIPLKKSICRKLFQEMPPEAFATLSAWLSKQKNLLIPACFREAVLVQTSKIETVRQKMINKNLLDYLAIYDEKVKENPQLATEVCPYCDEEGCSGDCNVNQRAPKQNAATPTYRTKTLQCERQVNTTGKQDYESAMELLHSFKLPDRFLVVDMENVPCLNPETFWENPDRKLDYPSSNNYISESDAAKAQEHGIRSDPLKLKGKPIRNEPARTPLFKMVPYMATVIVCERDGDCYKTCQRTCVNRAIDGKAVLVNLSARDRKGNRFALGDFITEDGRSGLDVFNVDKLLNHPTMKHATEEEDLIETLRSLAGEYPTVIAGAGLEIPALLRVDLAIERSCAGQLDYEACQFNQELRKYIRSGYYLPKGRVPGGFSGIFPPLDTLTLDSGDLAILNNVFDVQNQDVFVYTSLEHIVPKTLARLVDAGVGRLWQDPALQKLLDSRLGSRYGSSNESLNISEIRTIALAEIVINYKSYQLEDGDWLFPAVPFSLFAEGILPANFREVYEPTFRLFFEKEKVDAEALADVLEIVLEQVWQYKDKSLELGETKYRFETAFGLDSFRNGDLQSPRAFLSKYWVDSLLSAADLLRDISSTQFMQKINALSDDDLDGVLFDVQQLRWRLQYLSDYVVMVLPFEYRAPYDGLISKEELWRMVRNHVTYVCESEMTRNTVVLPGGQEREALAPMRENYGTQAYDWGFMTVSNKPNLKPLFMEQTHESKKRMASANTASGTRDIQCGNLYAYNRASFDEEIPDQAEDMVYYFDRDNDSFVPRQRRGDLEQPALFEEEKKKHEAQQHTERYQARENSSRRLPIVDNRSMSRPRLDATDRNRSMSRPRLDDVDRSGENSVLPTTDSRSRSRSRLDDRNRENNVLPTTDSRSRLNLGTYTYRNPVTASQARANLRPFRGPAVYQKPASEEQAFGGRWPAEILG